MLMGSMENGWNGPRMQTFSFGFLSKCIRRAQPRTYMGCLSHAGLASEHGRRPHCPAWQPELLQVQNFGHKDSKKRHMCHVSTQKTYIYIYVT